MPNSVVIQHRGPPLWCGALVLVWLSAGCSTLPAEKYTFRNMPATYIAAHRDNPHTIDLTRLAGSSKKSDSIDKGDVLKVTIAAGLSAKDTISIPVRVQENGVAQLPEIGPVALAGLEVEAAEAAIVGLCMEQDLYRNPHVTVTIEKQRTNRVMVVGAVEKPDIYELPRGNSDLFAALVAAGGLSKDAGTVVQIRNPQRGSPLDEPAAIADAGADADGVSAAGHSLAFGKAMTSMKVDLVSATRAGSSGYQLDDGGVVHVEKRDPEPVFVQGLVTKPDRYEYPIAEELRLLGAIAMAGGTSNPVADKIYVIRRKPNSTETVLISLKLSDAKRNERANLLLAPGDVVSVEQTTGTVIIDTLRLMNLGFGASLPLTALF